MAFTFEITEHIGDLGINPTTGMTKELNKVSWNGRPAKYDIRDWDEDHEKMSKGVTLSNSELSELKDLLSTLDLSGE